MSALSEPCPSYEPHFWKMGKCKNCFFSRGEHKRYRKELQAEDDVSSTGDVSPHDSVDGDSSRVQLKRREARDEMKQLRKERKALASKHSELRDTMMTMEAQMLDYKETKQENDILTKDMKLLRKDLHEITAGAARACEQNELLRQEAAMLRLCLEENGVEAPQTLLDARFQQQPDSPFASALPSVASSPRAPLSSKAGEAKKEAKKEAPERAVPGLKLAPRPQESAASAHPSLALAPIIHEIDSCLFSLRQNCSTIIQDTEESQAVVSLNFVLGMVRALERQASATVDMKRTMPQLQKETSKGFKNPFSSSRKEKEKPADTSKNEAKKGNEREYKGGEEEEEGERKQEEKQEKEQEAKEGVSAEVSATPEADATESTESEGKTKKKRSKKTPSRESKAKDKHSGSSPAESKRGSKLRPKKSIGGKLVAGLKKRTSVSVPKLSTCSGDAALMDQFAAYLAEQGLVEEGRFLELLRATEDYAALSSASARIKAFRGLCDSHVTQEGAALAEDLRTALLDARQALEGEEKTPPSALVERAAGAARSQLDAPFRSFSLRSSS